MAASIEFIIDGKTYTVPAACFDFPLNTLGDTRNPAAIQDAIRRIAMTINFSIPAVIQNVVNTVLDESGLVNAGLKNGVLAGDNIWIKKGPPLPAAVAGGQQGPNIIGHIWQYAGAGAAPPAFAAAPAVPSGAYVTLVEDARVDPVRHVVGLKWNFAAKPFTTETPWISYNIGTDVVSHEVTSATSGASLGESGSFIQFIGRDAKNHIIEVAASAPPAPATYTASAPWIALVGNEFRHGTATAGSTISASASVLAGYIKDAQNHIISELWASAAGGYTALAPWITLSGTEFQHGTTAAGTVIGFVGGCIETLEIDDQNHVVNHTSVGFPIVSTGNAWISVEAVAGPSYLVHHDIPSPQVAAGSAVAGAGSAVDAIYWDSFRHIQSVRFVALA